MSGRFAATLSSSVSAVSVKPPRRRRTAWLGTVRPARRNGQRKTKATTNTSANPAAAAQSLRAAGGIGWRRFRPGSRTLTTLEATRRRSLSNRDESRGRADHGPGCAHGPRIRARSGTAGKLRHAPFLAWIGWLQRACVGAAGSCLQRLRIALGRCADGLKPSRPPSQCRDLRRTAAPPLALPCS